MQTRHMELRCKENVHTEFLRDRLYVARTLVPEGYESYFRQKARYRSVHSSVSIEGNKLGEQQALFVLVNGANETDPDELEVRNVGEAYDLIQQIANDETVRVDEGLIRAMNSLILRGLPDPQSRSRGQYRVGPSLIVNAQSRAVRYRPPPPEWVPELMAALVVDVQGWLDAKTYSGPVIAALAHFGLISIHPFTDGNGRTARLLADMILQKTGWSADGMIAVDASILARQGDYYESLRSTQGEDYQDSLDVSRFVEFHTMALEHAAIELEQSVIEFRRRLDSFREATAGELNDRQTLAFMFMMDISNLSTTTYAELTHTSQTSAYYDLVRLLKLGWVDKVGRGRNTRYKVADHLLRVISDLEQGKDDEARAGEE